jgi:uncharacterized membrane protein YhiD involved in acid resistance
MNLTTNFQQLGIALGLGLVVGLQRESAASRLAGMRTFPLVTLLGAVLNVGADFRRLDSCRGFAGNDRNCHSG